MNEIIKTENITKFFGNVKAVDEISLNVNRGEIYGFLGLNGAGKTTTIRMLLGMIKSTSGSAYIFGKKIKPDLHELWNKIGYLVEIPYSYPDLTVEENLEICRKMRLITNHQAVTDIMQKLKIEQYKDRKAKNLSLGNAQRLGLAKALIHNPEILILDEPANGLDPEGIVEIRELIRDLAINQGVTVFISSHILGEISRFATRIGIIHEGKLIQELSIEELENQRLRKLVLNSTEKEKAFDFLKNNGFQQIKNENGYLEITDKQTIEHPEKVANLLVNNGFPLTLLKVEEEDLETYFLRTIHQKK